MTDTEWAYIAGIIDGEGCVYVDRWIDKRRSSGKYNYIPRIKVGMTHEGTVRYLQEKLTGSFYIKEELRTNRYKYQYIWKISSKVCIEVCKKLIIYSITKKNNLKLLIDFENTMTDHLLGGNYRKLNRLPEELYDERERIFMEIKKLNKRGR